MYKSTDSEARVKIEVGAGHSANILFYLFGTFLGGALIKIQK